MKINVLFILLAFIVIVILAISKDLTTSLLLILLFANIIRDLKPEDIHRIIKPSESVPCTKVDLLMPKPLTANVPPIQANTPAAESKPVSGPQQTAAVVKNAWDIYGPGYENWNTLRGTYTTSYGEAEPHILSSCSEKGNDVDSRNTLLWQKRTVDQQRNDGWAAKDANYYAYHYAEEFDTEENLPWWGRTEW